MRLVDRGLEALIAPSEHVTPWSGLAALGAAVAGLAVLGMAAKDNPLFGLPITDSLQIVQPNALVLRAFREARKTTPDVGWGRPFGEWSPAEVAVFMDWAQDQGVAGTMDRTWDDQYPEMYGIPHVACKELNTPLYNRWNDGHPAVSGYWTVWQILNDEAAARLANLDDEQAIAALLDAYGLEGDIPRGRPDAVVGYTHEGTTRAMLKAFVNTREPLRGPDESNHNMLERSETRAPVHESFLDYLTREIKDRKAP